MSKKVIIQKFNDISKDLLNDVSTIVGQSYLIKFQLITKFNHALPIQKFQLNVLKFKNIILDKNSEYFKNDNIILDEINDCNMNDKEYYMDEYYKLKNIYQNIDDKSKENFWDILKVLIFLCEKYHN